VLNERHLLAFLTEFVCYYNHDRPNRTIELETPVPSPPISHGDIVSRRSWADLPHEIWIGPIGPIKVVWEDSPQRLAASAASRVAQAAVECDDLIALVRDPSDPLVRMEAVPRLKARFPSDSRAHDALINAVTDVDEAVRCAAISAIADLALPRAGDLLAAALRDEESDVRFVAAIALQQLGDARAPDDPETFAYRGT